MKRLRSGFELSPFVASGIQVENERKLPECMNATGAVKVRPKGKHLVR
jgi:hypothetical protein